MRAAAILGLGCSQKNLKPFQSDQSRAANNIEWRMGMPVSGDDADVILLFGGDGTVHRHLGQLVKLGLPVLVVPAGSGNDFARALGLQRVRDSLEAWRKFCGDAGNVRAIDLGFIVPLGSAGGAPAPHADACDLVSGPLYFACVAGVGFDGEVTARANRLPRWLRGHGGYALSLIPTILTFAPLSIKILAATESCAESPVEDTCESASWTTRSSRPTLLAAFANTPSYGGGMKIAPRARMDDGLLDVCVIGAVERFRLLRLFPSVYSGNHLRVSEAEYFQAGRVRVESERPLDVYADGEYVCRTPVELAVHREALKVVVPEIG
jgi:diacylglycerol kinase (ATP)